VGVDACRSNNETPSNLKTRINVSMLCSLPCRYTVSCHRIYPGSSQVPTTMDKHTHYAMYTNINLRMLILSIFRSRCTCMYTLQYLEHRQRSECATGYERHVCTRASAGVCVRACVRMCVHVCAYVCLCVCVCVCVCMCVCLCMCMCMCVFVCACVCVCLCECVCVCSSVCTLKAESVCVCFQ